MICSQPFAIGRNVHQSHGSIVGDLGLIPGSGRPPGEGTGNPFQYSCLENPMDGRVWQATVSGVAESNTTE